MAIHVKSFQDFIISFFFNSKLTNKKIQELVDTKVTFETFFQKAKLNPNAHLITGVICGYRIEEIYNPLMKQVRFLDKLVDELAKGKKMGFFCVVLKKHKCFFHCCAPEQHLIAWRFQRQCSTDVCSGGH